MHTGSRTSELPGSDCWSDSDQRQASLHGANEERAAGAGSGTGRQPLAEDARGKGRNSGPGRSLPGAPLPTWCRLHRAGALESSDSDCPPEPLPPRPAGARRPDDVDGFLRSRAASCRLRLARSRANRQDCPQQARAGTRMMSGIILIFRETLGRNHSRLGCDARRRGDAAACPIRASTRPGPLADTRFGS